MRDSGAPLNLVVGRKTGMEVNRNSSIFVSLFVFVSLYLYLYLCIIVSLYMEVNRNSSIFVSSILMEVAPAIS